MGGPAVDAEGKRRVIQREKCTIAPTRSLQVSSGLQLIMGYLTHRCVDGTVGYQLDLYPVLAAI